LNFGILGPLEICEPDRPIPLGALKQRVVLGLLLCNANRIVPVQALSHALWSGDPPRSASKNLQVYVSTLRRAIGAGRGDAVTLAHTPPGYTLRLAAPHLDALRFHDLVQAGRRASRAGDYPRAVDVLGRAVDLWRGPALPDLRQVPAVATAAEQLDEQYLYACEDWLEAQLAIGCHTQVVEAADELVRANPTRERLRHTQMLALYRCGRQTEALTQFDDLRQRLAREVGLQPSPVLTRLYQAILDGDRSLDLASPTRVAPGNVYVVPSLHAGLTRDTADFTGRSRVTAELLGELERPGSVIVLTGPPGIGKTTLAVHCVHRLGSRYPHGRVITALRAVEGTPRSTVDILADLLRATGTDEVPTAEAGELAAALRRSVAGRDLLFVLDDAVDEYQVRPLIAAVGDATVLVTSRWHLGGLDSTHRLSLPPMSAGESLELLRRVAGAGRVEAESSAASRLVAICGGSPLVVRIVGAKLRALPHLSVARYAERLGDETGLLDELAAGDPQIVPRLARWYQDLAPQDRTVLHCLAALPGGGGTVAALADALGTDALAAERAMERLIEAHLATVRRPPRHEVTPLLRVFLRQHAAAV